MKKTIGILAHVDAGKTTFSEYLLYHFHTLRSLGRVDDKNSFLDTDPIEKQRGITVFSGIAHFHTEKSEYTLIDTPGHMDFAAEMERSLPILDFAILLVSCVEGIQSHTEALWQLLKEYQIPVFFFLNKTDRIGADYQKVYHEIQKRFSLNAIDFSTGFDCHGKMTVDLAEQIAELDERLFENYLESGYSQAVWLEQAQKLLSARKLFPVFCGSALTGEGMERFFNALDILSVTSYAQEENRPFSANVFQIRHDAKKSRLTFCKVLSGKIRVKENINGEKINEIRFYNGERYELSDLAEPGDICAVTGPLDTMPGTIAGSEYTHHIPYLHPVLVVKVSYEPQNFQQCKDAFSVLGDEDPSLSPEWVNDGNVRELRIHVMGKIQLEVLEQVLIQRFHLNVKFGQCEVCYLETIQKPVIGIGHFEPLRHYAEVQLLLSPASREAGITFESQCSTDILDISYQNNIKTHIFEKEHLGVLTGSPITDIHITLLNGRSHLKHTEGGDFREAVYRAIRQGLAQAESVLLEPYYHFTITAPPDALGRILSDIPRLHGYFEPPIIEAESATICGHGPVSTFMNYASELPSFTQGRGIFTAHFGGYEPCHNPEEIISGIGYEMEHDTENPPDSVFCAKGAGYPVKWYEVPKFAHCEIKKLL